MVKIVVPGERLGTVTSCVGEEGTVIEGPFVCSCIFGTVSSRIVEESGQKAYSVKSLKKGSIVPQVGQIVICQCVKVNMQQAKFNIFVCERTFLASEFPGVVRVEDIRPSVTSTVYSSYRPGDIVRAKIISLGDSRNYFLSTAGPDFGVLHAQSEHGNKLQRVSMNEMIDPVTKRKEPRKVCTS